MTKTLLIDGDLLAYRFASSNTTTFNWDSNTTSQTMNLNRAITDLKTFVDKLVDKIGCSEYLLCFTSSPCFRYDILPSYKHNRVDKEKPQLLQPLKDYALENLCCKVKDKLEADDVLGVMSTLKPGKCVVASIDKDLQQIPGWHYDWVKERLFEVSDDEADLFFYTQVLTGDSTDGYSGCPSIGPKRAFNILSQGLEPWQAILHTYELKGLTEEHALTQARVARILRASDYDFKNGCVIPWQPTLRK